MDESGDDVEAVAAEEVPGFAVGSFVVDDDGGAEGPSVVA